MATRRARVQSNHSSDRDFQQYIHPEERPIVRILRSMSCTVTSAAAYMGLAARGGILSSMSCTVTSAAAYMGRAARGGILCSMCCTVTSAVAYERVE